MRWRLVLLSALACMVFALSATAAVASDCDGDGDEAAPGLVIGCPDETVPPAPDPATDQTERVDYEPPEFWAYQPVWGTQPESGETCIDLQFRANVEPNSTLAIDWEMQTLQMMADPRLEGSVDRWCDAAAAEAMETPTLLANGFVRRLPLPEPQLEIDPGFALTGMPAYLVIGNQEDFTVTEQLGGWGTMQVAFTPTAFEVDWGDGTVEVVADGRSGARWNGPSAQQISHVYIDSDRDRAVDGNTMVTVTSTWSADWSVAGFSGTVPGMVIDESFDLPVREYRAVRGDPSG
jgi:hypothetical protein